MKTITILVGNSDNKLTQYDWSAFILEMDEAIKKSCNNIHFFGGSHAFDPWQNAAWVVGVYDMPGKVDELKHAVTLVRERFHQDSAAVVVGDTEFI